ncbi:transglutaminase-like cysteine peptidase [Temperatibacter marinus]|uniref:Transglutaminase-like cysteine peptidase n=1 Tax=Temperatibacter marinus TaxID=1456591 RepID=A0AA52EG67_9PROT|nr:transglutaminase-like cysteine peptidase [Temperatibacter marinus]WND04140.1 transglutaminase-like cysteine peptidase [Temperatibacter marinus]
MTMLKLSHTSLPKAGILFAVILYTLCAPFLAHSQDKSKTEQAKGTSFFRPSSDQPKATGLFGYRELRYTKMGGFKKWLNVLERQNVPAQEQIRVAKTKSTVKGRNTIRLPNSFNGRTLAEKKGQTDCSRFNRVACRKNEWNTLIANQITAIKAGGSKKEVLDAVNLFMNNTPYIVDPRNWGVPDYWATPTEFFFKDGDCEDYAISKYVTLKRIGLEAGNMRLLVGQDNNSRVEHAVLAVKIEGLDYILDNQVNEVLPHTKIRHFTPVYAINEEAWWRFLRQRRFN